MDKLILGLVVFFGGHLLSLLALGWRDRMANRLGVRSTLISTSFGLHIIQGDLEKHIGINIWKPRES
jgi:hypothetical protein